MWSIAIGISSGIASSALFLAALTLIRPRLALSKCITREKLKDGSLYYQIKVVNHTRFPLARVQAELLHGHRTILHNDYGGSPLLQTRPILLKRSYLLRLARYDRRDWEANYAFRFVAYDIEDHTDPSDRFLFRIYAEHTITGAGSIFEHTYTLKSIVDGDFEGGDSLNIVPVTQPFRKPTRVQDDTHRMLGEIVDWIRSQPGAGVLVDARPDEATVTSSTIDTNNPF